jgi:hypothetical protein
MEKQLILFSFLILLSSTNIYSQQFNMGLKVDLKYQRIESAQPYIKGTSLLALPAFLLKTGVLFFDNLELEFDGGYQPGDRFAGIETAALIKYRVWDNIFPFVTYINHQNDGHSGTGDGTSNNTFNYFGAGFEYKVSKLFSGDLAYYYPLGKRGYDYEFSSDPDKFINTTQVGSLVKLGFIFSFYP